MHVCVVYRPSLSVHYSAVHPLNIIRGRGQFLYDENNQAYLDCINNVTHGNNYYTLAASVMLHKVTQGFIQR